MRPPVATARPALGAQRCFECNRLAEEFQAQSYEAALPRTGRLPDRKTSLTATEGSSDVEQLCQKGVAA
jgi:hypothetical protein